MRIRQLIKWILIVIGSLVGLGVIGIAIVYVIVGNDLSRTFDVTGTSIVVMDDKASVAEGERLARVHGCAGRCHGDDVNGAVFFEVPDGTRVFAADLAAVVRLYSIDQLELVIRHGIRPNGTSVIGAMPSNMFYHLSDRDLGAIIAYLKSQQPVQMQLPENKIGPITRLLFFYLDWKVGTLLTAEKIDHDVPRTDYSEAVSMSHGRYLAITSCSECHGDDLRGTPNGFVPSPSLAIVAAYSLDEFRNLMRTGEPIGDRKLDVMVLMAEDRFSYLNDREVASLHTYLQKLAATANQP